MQCVLQPLPSQELKTAIVRDQKKEMHVGHFRTLVHNVYTYSHSSAVCACVLCLYMCMYVCMRVLCPWLHIIMRCVLCVRRRIRVWTCHIQHSYSSCLLRTLNPFTAPACKLSGLKDAQTRLRNSILSGPITHPFSVRCVLMKILSHANAKKKTA